MKGTKNLIRNSEYIKHQHPAFFNQLASLKQSQRYSVLRVWIDKDIRPEVPFFIFTDALKILDSVTAYHRMEKTSREWVRKNGGGIFEFHSYALPDDFPEKEVRHQFLKECEEYFPQIKGCTIKYEHLQIKDDFTAFHTNLFNNRPGVKTGVDNLFLAGDWVKLDNPAMLMEAAAHRLPQFQEDQEQDRENADAQQRDGVGQVDDPPVFGANRKRSKYLLRMSMSITAFSIRDPVYFGTFFQSARNF